jgi:hypothetical protein
MNDVRLPQDVLNRFERRWAARFPPTPRPSRSSVSLDDPLRSSRIRRLLEGSLRPPTRDRDVDLSRMA